MFTLDGVTLRPLELTDLDALYAWWNDTELRMWGGWTPVLSRAAFTQRWTRTITEPRDEMQMFTIDALNAPAGFIQLADIQRDERRAMIGIAITDPAQRGKGTGSVALRLLCDYAFTVPCLERLYAEVYSFNARSMRLFERVGFVREGTLRQHEYHNGARQDMHIYGLLKPEFYARYQTIFALPDA
jgi:RimJ/RimL family protein N-acetyltransferase